MRKQRDPEVNARVGARLKAYWADPVYRARFLAKRRRTSFHSTPESQAKASASMKSYYTDPEARAQRSASAKADWARRKAAKENS